MNDKIALFDVTESDCPVLILSTGRSMVEIDDVAKSST